MSSYPKLKAQLAHLSDYDLSSIYLASKVLIKDRGLNIKSASRPRNIKHLKGSPSNQSFIKVKEFDDYISSDWNYLIDRTQYDQDKKYYVYIHSDPRLKGYILPEQFKDTGTPFYIGKGTGKRYLSKTRSKPHRSMINNLDSLGYKISDISKIYEDNMTESDALILEAKLINYFGCWSEIGNLKKPYISGMRKGCLINTDTSFRPKEIDALIRKLKGF